MKLKFYLWILLSILPIILGILCIANPLITMSFLSSIIGIAMFLSGVGSLIYFTQRRSYLMLIDGIFSCIFSGVLLFGGDYIAQSFVPLFVAIWLILKGGLWITHTFRRKSLGLSPNPILLLIGSISVLLGLVFIIFPEVLATLISFILGFIFITIGGIGLFLCNAQKRFDP